MNIVNISLKEYFYATYLNYMSIYTNTEKESLCSYSVILISARGFSNPRRPPWSCIRYIPGR